MFRILIFATLMLPFVAQADETPKSTPKQILSQILGGASNCAVYTLEDNARAYVESCVHRVVDSALWAAELVNDPAVANFKAITNSILSCRKYSVNRGANMPIDSTCVDVIVQDAQGILK